MNEIEKFEEERSLRITGYRKKASLLQAASSFVHESIREKYSYNFSWMGRPIIQYPQDMIAMQEIIWAGKPDLIIETGIAHGGSLIYYASLLELIGGQGEVIGIDLDIRSHNRKEIVQHPMYRRITMMEGSSTDERIVQKVHEFSRGKERILVCLDSNHTHDHVLREMELYAPLVTLNSYLVVFDTIIGKLSEDLFPDRPWNLEDNPSTAVGEFLNKNKSFRVDDELEKKLLITVVPGGYLRRIKLE